MRLVLAGASGVVGRRLLPLLTAAGCSVVALTRSRSTADVLRGPGVTPAVVDVTDRDALVDVVREAAPDVVLHQLTDLGDADLAANAQLRRVGTRNLVDAALAAGAKRMVAQSISWAGVAGDGPAREGDPLDVDAAEPRRTSVRGVAALEAAVGEMPEAVVLRYGLFYGPGTWYAPDGSRADAARAGRLVADAAVSSFVHVDDAAAAALAALEWPAGVVNICDDEPAAGSDWVPAFCAAVGAPEPPRDDSPRPGTARGADNTRARTALGWTPRYPSWRGHLGTS
ncbi:NAD-dependent epimerase/dehydratase family protein [Pseudonocardia sp. TRM90224]|uniref:NAD-dependent epimerase/dehydratase family protein n=1 Tax=Pseudonocardia sp. TRM90224 TaxID=2812678 RepID=UPI001E651DCB|nr:NAD(P)-dependent oxidoreductase [Pseudonocardia sp. TRM90224]